MSHIVEIRTQVRDPIAVHTACRRLGLAEPVEGMHSLYQSTAVGLGIHLPNWRYPVVCDVGDGEIQFDNFNGHWGAIEELHRFLQAYAVEKAKLEGRRHGHTVTEQAQTDGSIRVTIHQGA